MSLVFNHEVIYRHPFLEMLRRLPFPQRIAMIKMQIDNGIRDYLIDRI